MWHAKFRNHKVQNDKVQTQTVNSCCYNDDDDVKSPSRNTFPWPGNFKMDLPIASRLHLHPDSDCDHQYPRRQHQHRVWRPQGWRTQCPPAKCL